MESNNFGEYVKDFASKFGAEDLLSQRFGFRIHNAKNDVIEGLKFYLGDKAKWLNEYDEIVSWLECNEQKGLLCMGNCGRGKTLICSKIIPVMLYKHFNKVVSKYSMQELSDNIDKVLGEKLVMIDDVGTEAVVSVKYGERRQPFSEIVDNAEKTNSLLIITTNLPPSQIREKYGDRTLDRLKEITKLVTFEGQSLRGK